MSYGFRPAVRENVNLIIGLAGGTGSGKTYSAMRLAAGIAGDKRFAVIDTERGRAKHYADDFNFDVAEMNPPFNPASYSEAIGAADREKYPVVVVDSMSHSWAGEGGCLDMQEAEYQRLGNRDSVKLLSWAKPKGEHKRMVAAILAARCHVILCFRAEEKVEIRKKDGKTEIVKKEGPTGLLGWMPISEKSLPFELTASALLVCDQPGVPHWIKLQQQHKALFPAGTTIDEEAGRRIALWARGKKAEEGDRMIDFARFEDMKFTLLECDAESLPVEWAKFDKVCVDAGDATTRRKLAEIKDQRKKELGL